MSKLSMIPHQIHVMRTVEEPDKLKVVTNTFVLSGLTFEELNYAVSPFIGASGKLEIHVYDNVGSEQERKVIYEHLCDLMDTQRRASGFLSPVHSALQTYWHNVVSDRQRFDIRPLNGLLEGVPVLWIGAGPSSSEHVGLIKEIQSQNRAFVATGGTGITFCDNNDIVPDLCLAVDPFVQEVERFNQLDKEWQEETILLASMSLNPICYELWKGPLIAAEGISCMNTGEFIEGKEIVNIPEGPVGVTTWMLELFKYMGAQEIYLIGTDLCFGKNGETYADDLDLKASEYQSVLIDGKESKSNWIFESKWIGNKAVEYEYYITNCSKGLKIPNTREGELTELLDREPHTAQINLKPWKSSKTKKIKENLAEFAKELRYTHDNLWKEDLGQQVAYIYLLKQYDDVAEYIGWRTGFYSYSLLREVLYKNADLIDKVLAEEPYPGELMYGHLGSPVKPGSKRVIYTGSKNFEENSSVNRKEVADV